jgi:hypothetical protein
VAAAAVTVCALPLGLSSLLLIPLLLAAFANPNRRVPGWQNSAAAELELVKKMAASPNAHTVQQWSKVGMFAAELYLWFKVGEIVGRPGHPILGYEVKPPCPVCGTRNHTAGHDGPFL